MGPVEWAGEVSRIPLLIAQDPCIGIGWFWNMLVVNIYPNYVPNFKPIRPAVGTRQFPVFFQDLSPQIPPLPSIQFTPFWNIMVVMMAIEDPPHFGPTPRCSTFQICFISFLGLLKWLHTSMWSDQAHFWYIVSYICIYTMFKILGPYPVCSLIKLIFNLQISPSHYTRTMHQIWLMF